MQYFHAPSRSPGLRRRFPLALAALFLFAALSGCSARKNYPEPNYGWHSPSFTAIYGQLQRRPGSAPDAPPVWVIRFGTPSDSYQGEFALTPPERLAGYSGGENVEIHGHVFDQQTTDAYNGRWYVVDSIQMWAAYK